MKFSEGFARTSTYLFTSVCIGRMLIETYFFVLGYVMQNICTMVSQTVVCVPLLLCHLFTGMQPLKKIEI